MPGKIKILPDSLSQMIAAGEVIERPASVVKELMENAIDAGSSKVVVELKAGGFQLIRVQDDGEGMDREEVPIALERHATSKIKNLQDLYAIQTLGFRGEALPSIASVSQMVIKTRTAHSVTGTKLVCEGGDLKSLSEVGCPVGTEVEVKNIFFNIPVKRKFLKSISLELRHALSQFLRLSLAHPLLTFKFIHDGRLLHEHLRTEVMRARIEAIFGRENSDQLQAFTDENDDVHLSGWASLPTFSRGNRDGIYLYVNGRYVRDRTIYKAILEAYRHVIPQGRFPMVILFLTVPPSAVDVNVHPTKTEVRFKEPERLFPAVFSALHSLRQSLPSLKDCREDGMRNNGPMPEAKTLPLPLQRTKVYPQGGTSVRGINDSRICEGERTEGQREESHGGSLRVLGQVLRTYILCEDSEGLIFIDQHAAHERLLFERFKKGYETKSLSVNRFLTPVLMECSSEEVPAINDHREDLNAMGIEVDLVGKKIFAIRSIPTLIGHEDPKSVIRKMLEEEVFDTSQDKGKETLHPALVALSCHSAIRANFEMRREEMEALVNDLLAFPFSTTCPHGRPIFFRLPLADLEKQFKRNPR